MDPLDDTSSIKFGDLQREERYQKLERKLKLAFLKQLDNKRYHEEKDACFSPTWPSISSIAADQTDSSYAVPSLHVSRIGSEVVSSSANLKNMISHKSGSIPVATSSVKSFCTKNNHFEDRLIMPPPSTYKIPSQNSKKSTPVKTKSHYNRNRDDNVASNMDLNISVPNSINDSSTSSIGQDASTFSQSDSQDHNIRTFSRWRVLINNQRQLIIKGTLDCGRIARSKPVIRRLSATSVQSIYKHTYILKGNLVDEHDTLPEYVRGKFHNGFPDDWENVCQIWRNYIDNECQLTFRWPMPISDSDDDLQSEISEMPNYLKSTKVTETKETMQHENNVKDSHVSSGYCSINPQATGSITDNPTRDSSKDEFFKETEVTPPEEEKAPVANVNKDTQQSKIDDCEKFTSGLCDSGYLSEIIKEDKLAIMIRNIMKKNCPLPYLNKVLELFNCLRYISSYKIEDDNCESEKSSLSLSKNSSSDCHKCSKAEEPLDETPIVETSTSAQIERLNEDVNNQKEPECELRIDLGKDQEYSDEISSDDNGSHELSESETYAGVPKIKAIKLLQSRASDQHLQRYKVRRKRKYTCNELGNKPEIVDKRLKNLKSCIKDGYDSSVSITEDEISKHCKDNVNNQSKPLRIDREEGSLRKSNSDLKSNTVLNISKDNKLRQTHSHVELSTNTPPLKTYSNNSDKVSSGNKENIQMNQNRYQSSEKTQRNSYREVETNTSANPARTKPTIRSCQVILPRHVSQKESSSTSDPPVIDTSPQISTMKIQVQNDIEEQNNDVLSLNSNVLKTGRNTSERHTKEKTPSRDIQLAEKRSTHTKNKKIFGSQENPKMLASWVPIVELREDAEIGCGLKFEGKLLNEAGHVINRKFTTNFICKRLSHILLESEDHEFYLLMGEINDTKHVVPKELLNQCRSGCPAKINIFCRRWKSIRFESKAMLQACNSNVEQVSVPMSSRGRRILPCLNYWTGETIMTIDNDTFYKQGNSGESVLSSSSKSPSATMAEPSSTSNTRSKRTSPQESSSKEKSNKKQNSTSTKAVQERKNSRENALLQGSESSSSADDKLQSRKHLNSEEVLADYKLRKRQRVEYKISSNSNASDV